MSLRSLAVPFLLALLVPLLESLAARGGDAGALSLARGSLAALAILPWLVFSTWPRRERAVQADAGGSAESADSSRARAWHAPLLVGCLALPPLGLGAGLDLARGAEPSALAAAALGAWLVLVLWVGAAARAAAAPRARAAFAALWLVCLPGAATLRLALAWVPARAGASRGGADALFALDPLVWCHRWGRAGGLEAFAPRELLLAVGAALVALLVVLALARERYSDEPGTAL